MILEKNVLVRREEAGGRHEEGEEREGKRRSVEVYWPMCVFLLT